jgi:hypothetical protein
VVRYLKGSRNIKLHLGGSNNLALIGYSDSDWANCPDTRRSIGGFTFSLGSGVISWSARKQKTVAASSCEAEYVAAFNAAKENTWLRALLQNIYIHILVRPPFIATIMPLSACPRIRFYTTVSNTLTSSFISCGNASIWAN